MIKHLNIKIFGQVQGVFFRYSAKNKAKELDIKGFARNEPDGSVYIEAEGEEKNVGEFLDWCHYGPPLAKVERVESSEGEIENFTDFNNFRHDKSKRIS